MSRHHLSNPLSVLLAGVFIIVLLLAGTNASTNAVTRQQSSTPTWTPCIDDGSEDAEACFDLREQLTQEAEDMTAEAEENGTPTTDANGYPYSAPATPTQAQAGATSAATPTTTISPEPTVAGDQGGGLSPTATDPAVSAAETPAVAEAAAPSPTPTPLDGLSCVPGVPVFISGTGPARAPLLLFFNQRAVGGGLAGADGAFTLKLTVGQERPGQYQVMVRVRGTAQVVRELTCTVP